MKPRDLDLIILAGDSKCDHPCRDDKTYLQVSLEVTEPLPFARRIVVYGGGRRIPTDYIRAQPGTNLLESIQSGLRQSKKSHCLVLASDLVSSQAAIQDFCDQVGTKPNRPFYCGVARIEDCRLIRPGIRTHFICRYGKIRFASAYIIERAWFLGEPRIAAVLSDRKSIKCTVNHVLGYMGQELLRPFTQAKAPRLPKLVKVDANLAVDYDLL